MFKVSAIAVTIIAGVSMLITSAGQSQLSAPALTQSELNEIRGGEDCPPNSKCLTADSQCSQCWAHEQYNVSYKCTNLGENEDFVT